MDDETTDPGSGVPLDAETIATKKQLLSHHDSSIAADTPENAAEGPKRKCGKKVRRKSGTKKHRAGRKNRKQRKYKPYYRLSVAERRKVDERNEKRNSRKREFLHSCGVSLAPPNTTQFLFEDRQSLKKRLKGENDNSDLSSLSDYDGSDTGGSDEFQVMWMRESNQRFQKMTDWELRELFVNLEDEIEEAERRKMEETTKIRIFQDEVKQYKIAIEELTRLNAGLTKMLEEVGKVEKDVDKKDRSLESDSFSADTGAAV